MDELDPRGMQEEEAPDAETALALLQAVYREKQGAAAVRIRCASEALPY